MHNKIILFVVSSFLLLSSSVFAANPAIRINNTKDAPNIGPYSQAVAFSHYQNISAQLPINPKTGKMVTGGVAAQATQCLKNIKAIVAGSGKSMDDVVRMTIFVKNISDLATVDNAYKKFFPGYVPTRTAVAVAALPMGALVQIEALTSYGESTIPGAPQAGDLVKVTHHTDHAPKSVLSNQMVAFSHYNNISAQVGIDPKTGKMVSGGVKEQAEQALKNIKAILTSIDVPFDDIVKINIHLKNLADIDAVNEVYTTFFPDSGIARAVGYFPARSVTAAKGLPMNAVVQIEAVVSHGDGTPPQAVEDRHGLIIEASNTDNAPKHALSMQTAAFSHYNHISAQSGINPATGKMVSGGVKAQAEQALKNIKAIVESIGHTMSDTVKVNVQLKNIADIEAVNKVYSAFFKNNPPSRTVIGVSELPGNALVQIDAVVSNAEGTPPK